MPSPTVIVSGTIYDQTGTVVDGAVVTVQLSAMDVCDQGYVYPTLEQVKTGVDGVASFVLFPNVLGQNNTFYTIKCADANGKTFLTSTMVVPNQNTTFEAIVGSQPVTPQNSGFDGVMTIPFLDQGFNVWSYMKNFNKASRTYVFPDAAGTVAIMASDYTVKGAEVFSGWVEMPDPDGTLRKFMVCA